MYRIQFLFFLFISLYFSGCSTYVARYYFNYECAGGSPDNYTEKDELFARINSNAEAFAQYHYRFENDNYRLHLYADPEEIGLYLVNKTDSPIQIIWDSVKIYSDYIGDDPVPFTHINKTQDKIKIPDSTNADFEEIKTLINLQFENDKALIKPSIILSNKTWMDEIVPLQNKSLLPNKMGNEITLKHASKDVIGKKLILVLPIKVRHKIIYTIHIFTIKDYQTLVSG